MSGTIPQLILYPLYPGGPQVKANSGTLNANSSFKTRANAFVPAYGVNLPSNLQPSEADTYYTLTGTATISRRPISEAANAYSGNLGFDGTVTGGLKKVPVPAVAPQIPDLYRKAVELLSISDLKMADLLALPEFRIPGVGMGLKVTTDGMGGIDSVAINPSGRGVLGRPDATSPSFGGLNSAEISRAAAFSLTDLSINTGTAPIQQPTPYQPNQPVTVAPTDNNALQPQYTLNRLDRNAGIFNLEEQALRALQSQSVDLDRITPELARLYQLQAGDIQPEGRVQFGPDATQSQQIAASQVGLGVKTSDAFQANVVGLINANKQAENYASAFAPRMDQVMNGKIAASPWVGNQSAGTAGGGLSGSSSFEMGAAVADAMSRKGRGAGYMPFRMQSDTQEQGFGGSNPFLGANAGSSGGSQFGGEAGQQQYRPRRQLAFTA